MLTDPITTVHHELASEASITFVSRRYGASSDPTHTHELAMRVEADDQCREYVFQTDKGRNAANAVVGRLLMVQGLDELLARMTGGGIHIDGDLLDPILDGKYEAKLDEVHASELHDLGSYDNDSCATDGEFGSQF